MRKGLCLLLALVMLLGAIGWAAAEAEPVDSLPVVSLAKHKNTEWTKSIDTDTYPYYCEESLVVYKKGEAILNHDGVKYRVLEKGKTCLLEKDLYASPWDEKPALTLQVGEICVAGTDGTVHIQAVSDPLGIFEGFSPEDLTLSLHWNQPGKYIAQGPRYYGAAPHFQQGAEWYEKAGHRTAEGSIVFYSNCNLQAEADGTVHGTIQAPYGAPKEACTLLWASDAGALVRPDGELIYYGGLLQLDRFDDRDRYAEFAMKASYDPLRLSAGHSLILYKNMYMTEPRNVLGRSQHQIIADYTADGWTYEPLSLPWGEYNDYGERFLKLTRDGQMLLIYLEWDIIGRYGDEEYALAYVLIGADGTLESWGGMQPGDHKLADKYRLSSSFPFADRGLNGLMEDDAVLPLDDGRILVTYWGHEEGGVQDYILLDPR